MKEDEIRLIGAEGNEFSIKLWKSEITSWKELDIYPSLGSGKSCTALPLSFDSLPAHCKLLIRLNGLSSDGYNIYGPREIYLDETKKDLLRSILTKTNVSGGSQKRSFHLFLIADSLTYYYKEVSEQVIEELRSSVILPISFDNWWHFSEQEIIESEILTKRHGQWLRNYGPATTRVMMDLESNMNSLCSDIHYVGWQSDVKFEFECWSYVNDPSTLPDQASMGADYSVADAKKQIAEIKVLCEKLNGWLMYEGDEIGFVDLKTWETIYKDNKVKIGL